MDDAIAAARDVQPIWAVVPAAARAKYLRRAAQALLDEVDSLADLVAEVTRRPRTEALLAEILPAVDGLQQLADDGPAYLADRRTGGVNGMRAGRRSLVVRAPLGLIGVRGSDASPWLTPTLEVAAAVLTGNAVLLEPIAESLGQRLVALLERAGVPQGLVGIVPGGSDLTVCDTVVRGEHAGAKGTMLVLADAPIDRTVSGALWAAFAGTGRGPAAVGRIVVAHDALPALLGRLDAGARRLVVGDPRRPDTEVGPLADQADADRVRALIDAAVASGATLVCGGPAQVPGAPGPYLAPVILRDAPLDAPLLREPVPAPVLVVQEAPNDSDAIDMVAAARASVVSVWTSERRTGERIARSLPAELTFVNQHGVRAPSPETRMARSVESRLLASWPTQLRTARTLPYDASLVAASTAATRLLHGREHDRLGVLRDAARPIARYAGRLARDVLRG